MQGPGVLWAPGYKIHPFSHLVAGRRAWSVQAEALAGKWGHIQKHVRWKAVGLQNQHLKRYGTGSTDLFKVTYQVHEQPGQKSRCLQSTTAEITQHLVVQRQSQEEDVGSRDTRAHWPKVPMRITLGRRAWSQARKLKPPVITAKHPGQQTGDRETVCVVGGEVRGLEAHTSGMGLPPTERGGHGTNPSLLRLWLVLYFDTYPLMRSRTVKMQALRRKEGPWALAWV